MGHQMANLTVHVEGAERSRTPGGARYVAAAIALKFFRASYRWIFRMNFSPFGGLKMISSKADWCKCKEVCDTLPQVLLRF